MVHVIEGGRAILHQEDEALYLAGDGDGDLYWHPIGPACARRLGHGWSVALERAA